MLTIWITRFASLQAARAPWVLIRKEASDGEKGKKIGKGPDNLIDFLVEQFKVRVGLMLLYKRPGLFGGITGFILTVNDLTVFDIFIGLNHGVAYPFAVHLEDRHDFAD